MNVKIDPSLATSLETAVTPAEKTEALFAFLSRTGQGFYDESVTQLEHALQAAHLAKESGATLEQITAALLHDIGHFLTDEHSQESDFQTEDWDHENLGADQIRPFFPESVTEPIRLHVPAKRYLCTVELPIIKGFRLRHSGAFNCKAGRCRPRKSPSLKRICFLDRRCNYGAGMMGPKSKTGECPIWNAIARTWNPAFNRMLRFGAGIDNAIRCENSSCRLF